jgi:hypothetical protein
MMRLSLTLRDHGQALGVAIYSGGRRRAWIFRPLLLRLWSDARWWLR